jgi:beta-mannosidase
MAPYQEYPNYGARFVSEFGMQAYPHRATIDSFAPPAERFPSSRTLEHHNKAEGGVRRIAAYLADNLRPPADLDGMIYATQLIQAEAMAAAIRGWRRNFAGPGHYAMAGALIWQLNDCWPVTSWALIDYALRPKAAYYAVKRALAPLAVELTHRAGGADLWVVSQAPQTLTATVYLTLWTLAGELIARVEHTIKMAPNQATALPSFNYDLPDPVLLGAQLLVDGAIVSRAVLWPEPLKYLDLVDPGLLLTREGETVRLRVQRPVKGLWLDGGDGVQWSDNLLDLLPDEEVTITATGLGAAEIQVRWLGQEW